MEYKYGLSDKIIAYMTLISGLVISAVAVWYSVAGLVSIFAASAFSIIVMGVALEVSKLVATVWLKWNWKRAPRLIKVYLISAIAILMIITSMGIFGYLSKAHLDQNLVSGDVVDKVSLIDEKIKTQRDNIEAAKKALRQLDESVDQTMARSSDEKGADKAAALRRQQQRERTLLQNDIAKAQAEIAKLNDERAPIAKELRAVEAEVGPIKYIAKLIYGDNPDANILEKAVTWVIIIIVLVFDPLAVILLLASQYSFQWFREQEKDDEEIKDVIEDDLPEPIETEYVHSPWPFPVNNSIKEKEEDDFKFLAEYEDLYPKDTEPVYSNNTEPVEEQIEEDNDIIDKAAETEKEAMKKWKADNPNDSLKHQRLLLDRGAIDKLPWEDYLQPKADFVDEDAEAAAEAVKWVKEQEEKRSAMRAEAEELRKKKDNPMDGDGGESTSGQDQGRIEGYVQNAEQNSETIWNRIKKG